VSDTHRVLLVHAHPDDESINSGATMAYYVAAKAQVTLVTCTLGELGEIAVPELAGLAADRADQLGGYRVSELDRSMQALGVTDHRFLGGAGRWRDSGMMGTAGNADQRAFWRCAADAAAFDEATDSLVEVIREVRPQVLLTYDENGGYGHPDHIMAHRVAMAALDRAAVAAGAATAWTVPKVYYSAVPRTVLQQVIDLQIAAGRPSPFGVERAEELPFGNDDDEITTVIDASRFGAAKIAALRAHATQIPDGAPFFAIADQAGPESVGHEYYRLVRGELGSERDANGRETDLFAGTDG
jgi:N-acetyl-1-D-myo-inositol-2-amino-2-deoxy-alpha-D-glucopyranoside deacetylase